MSRKIQRLRTDNLRLVSYKLTVTDIEKLTVLANRLGVSRTDLVRQGLSSVFAKYSV